MKKFVFLFACLVLTSISTSSAQSMFEKWKELSSFHDVMSQTFHPSENDNFEPIKSRSSEMAMKADKLAKSSIPKEFKTEAIQAAVAKLQKDSKALNMLVKDKNTTDEQIKKSLASLHDVFHEIVGLCSEGKH